MACVIAVAMAGCSSPDTGANRPTAAGEGSNITVAVRPDEQTKAAVGDYEVTVPAGAVSATTDLQLRVLDPSSSGANAPTLPGDQARVLGTLQMALANQGQPKRPVTVTLKLEEPVPGNEDVSVLRRDDQTGPGVLLDAELDPSRTEVSFRTDHFSWFDTVSGSVAEVLGDIFSTRGATPSCQGGPPRWVSDVSFIDQQADPPVRVCAGSDPNDPDVVVVKYVNNRASGIMLTVDRKWKWVWTGAPGLVKSTVNEWVSGLSDPAAARSVFVMPGQQVHIGFANPGAGVTSIRIDGKVSLSSLGLGMAWWMLEEMGKDLSARTAYSAATTGVCFADAIGDPLARATKADITGVSTGIAKCALSQWEAISRLAKVSMTKEAWAKSGKRFTLLRGGMLRKLNGLLTATGFGFEAAWSVDDITQDPASRSVRIYPVIRKKSVKTGWLPVDKVTNGKGLIDGTLFAKVVDVKMAETFPGGPPAALIRVAFRARYTAGVGNASLWDRPILVGTKAGTECTEGSSSGLCLVGGNGGGIVAGEQCVADSTELSFTSQDCPVTLEFNTDALPDGAVPADLRIFFKKYHKKGSVALN